jgi:hypothetical protein
MTEKVEISEFDIRFESYRLKNEGVERKLIVSILENGIRDPLQGVDIVGKRILLNGFKRYRCAKKLNIGVVPYCSLGSDEIFGIIELMRISDTRNLSILEQAKFIDELKNVRQMSIGDIADLLGKSKAWVSVRAGIIQEMSQNIQNRIFSGAFPVYAYMYIMRPFMRINKIKSEQIEEFIKLVSGKSLSIRDIELLANGYFKGSEEFRQQMKEGHISWALKSIKQSEQMTSKCSQIELSMLKDLELTGKYMQRIICKSRSEKFKTKEFYAQSNLLSGMILKQMNIFNKAVNRIHDQSRKT